MPASQTTDRFSEVLCFNDIISKIIAQTLFQPGLSEVYKELFDFSGCEIYIKKYKEVAGKTFSDLLVCFENAAVIGIRNKQNIMLRPNINMKITEEDEIIFIAEDIESVQINEIVAAGNRNKSISKNTYEYGKSGGVLILG